MTAETSRWPHRYHVAVISLAMAFVGLTPFIASTASVAYDLKRFVQVGLLIAVALSVAVIPYARESLLSTWRLLPRSVRTSLVLLVVVGIGSSLAAVDPRHAFLEVVHIFLLGVLALVIATAVIEAREQTSRLVIWAIFGVALVYTVWVARDYIFSQLGLSYSFKGKPNALWPNGEFLGYAHPRFLNQVQTILIPFLVLPFLWSGAKSRPASYILLFVCAAWWALVFASGSRGTIVTCGSAFLVSSALFWRSSSRYYMANVATVIAGFGLFILLFKVFGETAVSVAERSFATSSERVNLWRHAVDLWKESPLVGIGPMHYALRHHTWGVHPHSALVQLLAEWGLVATAGAIFVVLRGMLGIVRRARDGAERANDLYAVEAAAVVSVLSGLAHAMLSGTIVMPAGQVAFVLAVGFILGLMLRPDAEQDRAPLHTVRFFQPAISTLVSLLIVAAVAEAVLVQNSFGGMSDRKQSAVDNTSQHKRLPRFWLWGCLNTYSAADEGARLESSGRVESTGS